VSYGETIAVDVAVGDLPYTADFTLSVEGGDGPISM